LDAQLDYAVGLAASFSHAGVGRVVVKRPKGHTKLALVDMRSLFVQECNGPGVLSA